MFVSFSTPATTISRLDDDLMFIRANCSIDCVSPQWIGIDDCRKPIKHGPTLAGLPGGLAGDLMRLYPVQSNEQYPVKVSVSTILGEYSYVLIPTFYKPRGVNEILRKFTLCFKFGEFYLFIFSS